MESDHQTSTVFTCGYGEEGKGKRNYRRRNWGSDEKSQRHCTSDFDPTSDNHLSKGWVFDLDEEKCENVQLCLCEIGKCEITSNSVFSSLVSTLTSTVFYIPTREEDFDPVKSRLPDVKGENDLRKTRKRQEGEGRGNETLRLLGHPIDSGMGLSITIDKLRVFINKTLSTQSLINQLLTKRVDLSIVFDNGKIG